MNKIRLSNVTRITLRLPTDLHALIDKQATEQDRSMNGQIIALLRYATAKGGFKRGE